MTCDSMRPPRHTDSVPHSATRYQFDSDPATNDSERLRGTYSHPHLLSLLLPGGLARIPDTPRRPACDYDYACVLAWVDAPSSVKGLGWSLVGGGNLYGRVRV
jgi:hypothetical protein